MRFFFYTLGSFYWTVKYVNESYLEGLKTIEKLFKNLEILSMLLQQSVFTLNGKVILAVIVIFFVTKWLLF